MTTSHIIIFNYVKRYYPVLVGAAAGYLYYSLTGCVTGKCVITSNPYTSIITGAFFGAAFIVKKKNKNSDETSG